MRHAYVREALDAVPRDGGGGRARLAGGARRLAPRQPERDGRDAAFDEQQVHRDLAEAPVVGGPGAEVRIARAAYSLQQLASPSVRGFDKEADGLAHPRWAVRRFIAQDERHVRLILTCMCENAPRTAQTWP